MISIGYQGRPNTYNETAAKKFAKHKGFDLNECSFIPLSQAEAVIKNLKANRIDFGLIQTYNSLSNSFETIQQCIDTSTIELAKVITIPIHNHIFVKDNINKEKITSVYSDNQTLKETHSVIKNILPDVQMVSEVDSYIAARKLKLGEVPDTYAVICRKSTGEHFGLTLLYENEDNNISKYSVFKKIPIE